MSITVTNIKQTRNILEGTKHWITLSNGDEYVIQRMNAAESMGLPGWHLVTGPSSNKLVAPYLADTKEEAINVILNLVNTQ